MPQIPVIDLFAGPGGLGEGFSGHRQGQAFKIRLSVEMDRWAHETLLLRAFYHQFHPQNVPSSYYQYLRGQISRDELESRHRPKFDMARHEAWCATLGEAPSEEVSARISVALGRDKDDWILIGGPPCQAYSIVGRSRIVGGNGREAYDKDPRHFLYREYLRIIATHQPALFVMENVKGLLSAKVNGDAIFPLILRDLQDPLGAFPGLRSASRRKNLSYSLHSIVVPPGLTGYFDVGDFIVRTENYGIPQARHRIIIIGVRDDLRSPIPLLKPTPQVSLGQVISDLPELRSALSKDDSPEQWEKEIRAITRVKMDCPTLDNGELNRALLKYLVRLKSGLTRGERFIPAKPSPQAHTRWYVDPRLAGVCNHETRCHIPDDLRRYFFVAVFAAIANPGRSPILQDFPLALLPHHHNVDEALRGSKFNDRFRVQLPNRPSTTVMSHISKDGHYYIHYDPAQCRSLTVREAARLQTFPDNYFFEGPRTEQYHQVGNAVPPFLAHQIAEAVEAFLR